MPARSAKCLELKGRGRGGTVDATDLKSVGRKPVWVRFPPPAPDHAYTSDVQRNRPGRFRCRPSDRSRPAATQRPARTCRGAGFPLMDAKPNMNTARTQSVPCGGRAASGWCLQAGYDGAARGRFRYRAAKGPRGGVEQDRDFQVRAVGRSASFDMARI